MTKGDIQQAKKLVEKWITRLDLNISIDVQEGFGNCNRIVLIPNDLKSWKCLIPTFVLNKHNLETQIVKELILLHLRCSKVNNESIAMWMTHVVMQK